MALPFTVEQFYGVFRDCNTAVWPAQGFLVALAIAALGAVLGPRPWSGVAVSAALSAAGTAVRVWQGVVRRRLAFGWVPGLKATAGIVVGMGLLATAGQRPRTLKP